MGIFIYSLTYIINRQTYKVLFISLLSSLIHSSGLFIFLAYIVSFLSLKSRISYILLLLSSIVIWKSGLGEKFFTFIALQFQDVIPNLYMYVKVFFYDHSLVQISQRLLLIIPLIYFIQNCQKIISLGNYLVFIFLVHLYIFHLDFLDYL